MLNSLSNINTEYKATIGEIVRKRSPMKCKSIRSHNYKWDSEKESTYWVGGGFNKEFSVMILDVVCMWNDIPKDECSFNAAYQAVEIMMNYDKEQQTILATPSVFNPAFYVVKNSKGKATFLSSVNNGTCNNKGKKYKMTGKYSKKGRK